MKGAAISAETLLLVGGVVIGALVLMSLASGAGALGSTATGANNAVAGAVNGSFLPSWAGITVRPGNPLTGLIQDLTDFVANPMGPTIMLFPSLTSPPGVGNVLDPNGQASKGGGTVGGGAGGSGGGGW